MAKAQSFKLLVDSKRPRFVSDILNLSQILNEDYYLREGCSVSTKKVITNTLKIRRQSLAKLSEIDGIEYTKMYNLLLNCPPINSKPKTGKSTGYCNRIITCPFCWTRKVTRNVFSHFAWLLYDTPNPTRAVQKPPLKRRVSVVCLQAVTYEDVSNYESIGQMHAQYCSTVKNIMYDPLITYCSLGSYGLVTIAPSGIPNQFKLTQTVIATVGADFVPKDIADKYQMTAQLLSAKKVTPLRLADMIGAACAYPKELVLGDPAEVMKILQSRAKTSKEPAHAWQMWNGFITNYHIHKTELRLAQLYREYCGDNDNDTKRSARTTKQANRRVASRVEATDKND